MKTLNTQDLTLVSGGTSKNDQLTTALTSIQSSIKDVATQKPSGGLDPTMLMMVMMMGQRQSGPTVVAAAPAPVAAAGPVVNISTRVRRGW
jgi:hypothetical protein